MKVSSYVLNRRRMVSRKKVWKQNIKVTSKNTSDASKESIWKLLENIKKKKKWWKQNEKIYRHTLSISSAKMIYFMT